MKPDPFFSLDNALLQIDLLTDKERSEIVEIILYQDSDLSKEVKLYVDKASGIIDVKNIMMEFHLNTKDEKIKLRAVIHKLCFNGVLERDGKRNGIFRKVDKIKEMINWVDAQVCPVPIKIPMGLDKEAVIEKGSVIVIAGVSNAGKSGFLLEMASTNCKNMKVSYLASEWSPSGLKQRLENFGENMDIWPDIDFIKRTKNFGDVIDPDGLNIIDFLETHDDFWAVSGEIQKYHDKLRDGVVIVALQKKPGADFGKGGHGTMEKSQLYLTIDDGIMTIAKLKQPPMGRKNLTGMSINYTYGKGGRLEKDGLWGNIETKQRKDMKPLKVIMPVSWANEEVEEEPVSWVK